MLRGGFGGACLPNGSVPSFVLCRSDVVSQGERGGGVGWSAVEWSGAVRSRRAKTLFLTEKHGGKKLHYYLLFLFSCVSLKGARLSADDAL